MVAIILLPLNAGAQKPALRKLTLTQIEDLVSHNIPDSTMLTEIQRRRLAFAPNPEIVESLRAKGAGPLTLGAVEAFFPKAPHLSNEEAARRLVEQIAPVYPLLARQARIQGDVFLDIMIAEDGNVSTAQVHAPDVGRLGRCAFAGWNFALRTSNLFRR